MQNIKFYTTVAIVGALADLGTNMYVSNANITSAGAKGLKEFYSRISAPKAMFYASLTFVGVVLIADLIVTGLKK